MNGFVLSQGMIDFLFNIYTDCVEFDEDCEVTITFSDWLATVKFDDLPKLEK
jgi:hypothetical protein